MSWIKILRDKFTTDIKMKMMKLAIKYAKHAISMDDVHVYTLRFAMSDAKVMKKYGLNTDIHFLYTYNPELNNVYHMGYAYKGMEIPLDPRSNPVVDILKACIDEDTYTPNCIKTKTDRR